MIPDSQRFFLTFALGIADSAPSFLCRRPRAARDVEPVGFGDRIEAEGQRRQVGRGGGFSMACMKATLRRS
jgi:hypothetical protein